MENNIRAFHYIEWHFSSSGLTIFDAFEVGQSELIKEYQKGSLADIQRSFQKGDNFSAQS